MKYMLLIYVDEAKGAQVAKEMGVAQMTAPYIAYAEALQKAGVIRGGDRLQPTSTATTVRVTGARGGDVVTSDGPYAETKEALTGFYLIAAADLDEAVAWAKKAAITCDVPGEVRELLFYPDPKGATD